MLSNKELELNHKLVLEMFDVLKKVCDENNIKYYVAEGTAIGTVREKGFIPWDVNMDITFIVDQYKKFDLIIKNNLPKDMIWERPTPGRRWTNWLRFKNSNINNPIPNIDVNILAPTSNHRLIRFIHLVILHYTYLAYRLKNSNIKRTFPYNVLYSIASLLPNNFYFSIYNYFLKKYDLNTSKYLINTTPGGRFHVGDIVKKEWFDGQKVIWGQFEGRNVRLPSNYDIYLRHYYGDYMTPVKDIKGNYKYIQ